MCRYARSVAGGQISAGRTGTRNLLPALILTRRSSPPAAETSAQYLYDQVKQQLRLQSDRPTALREAIHACRKGGSVFILGVFGLIVDKFPVGAIVTRSLKVMTAQMYGQRYIPEILGRLQAGELSTEHLATHVMPLEQGPAGYEMFKSKTDGCVRVVLRP